MKDKINNIKDKVKQYFSNTQNVVHCVLMVLLIISICLQLKILCSLRGSKFPHNIPFAQIKNNRERNNDIRKIKKMRQMELEKQRAMFKNFDKELEEMRRNSEKMFMDMDDIFKDDYQFFNSNNNDDIIYADSMQHKHIENGNINSNNNKRKFIYRPKLKELENSYVVSILLPDSVNRNDVKIDLKDKSLSIRITKTESQENSNSADYYFDSFSRVYYLRDVPKRYNKDNLNIKMNKNELRIEVQKEQKKKEGKKKV